MASRTIKKRTYICRGGPYDKYSIVLSYPASTLVFKVHANNQIYYGRYEAATMHSKTVQWKNF